MCASFTKPIIRFLFVRGHIFSLWVLPVIWFIGSGCIHRCWCTVVFSLWGVNERFCIEIYHCFDTIAIDSGLYHQFRVLSLLITWNLCIFHLSSPLFSTWFLGVIKLAQLEFASRIIKMVRLLGWSGTQAKRYIFTDRYLWQYCWMSHFYWILLGSFYRSTKKC